MCRLQQPGFIDPDHDHEYTHGEMMDKLRAAGFEVLEAKGLNLAGRSLARGEFSVQEVATNRGLFAEIEDCYLLSYLCRRPARSKGDGVPSDDPAAPGTGSSDADAGFASDDDAARRYLDEVQREIDDEVRRRRASGDLPLDVERDLDQQFLRHSPLGGRGAALRDMLRLVDASVFIDPVVPVDSRRPGGATVKRGLRSLSLWYLRYVTHQVSEFATAVSRALHVLDAQVTDLRRTVDAFPVAPSVVVEVPWAHHPSVWWVGAVTGGLAGQPGRVLHGACGDGWLVSALVDGGVDAYGVDPRSRVSATRELDTLDLRVEDVSEHLGAVAPGTLRAVVLSGVVEGSGYGERVKLARGGRPLPGPLRCPLRPLPDPGELGGRRRAPRGRHGVGPALPAAHLGPRPRRPGCRRHRRRGARGSRLPRDGPTRWRWSPPPHVTRGRRR